MRAHQRASAAHTFDALVHQGTVSANLFRRLIRPTGGYRRAFAALAAREPQGGRRAVAVAHEVAPATPAELAACSGLDAAERHVGLGEPLPQLIDLRLRQLRLQQRRVVRDRHHQRRAKAWWRRPSASAQFLEGAAASPSFVAVLSTKIMRTSSRFRRGVPRVDMAVEMRSAQERRELWGGPRENALGPRRKAEFFFHCGGFGLSICMT